MKKGFKEAQVKTIEFHKKVGIARDICGWSENKSVDTIVLSTRGRNQIDAFFMGETANNASFSGKPLRQKSIGCNSI